MCLLILPAAVIFRGSSQSSSAVNKEEKIADVDNKKCNTITENIEQSDSSSIDLCQAEEDNIKSKSFLLTIKKQFVILKNPVFILVMFYYVFAGIGANTYYALAVDYTVKIENLLSLKEAALGMTLTGVGTVIGSIFVMVLSHWSFDRVVFSASCTVVLGVCMAFTSVAKTLVEIYVVGIVFGIANGAYASGIASLIEYQFGQNNEFVSRYSYVLSVIGVGAVVGPLVAGYVGKAVGMSYSFYILGGSTITASALLILYRVVVRIRAKVLAVEE